MGIKILKRQKEDSLNLLLKVERIDSELSVLKNIITNLKSDIKKGISASIDAEIRPVLDAEIEKVRSLNERGNTTIAEMRQEFNNALSAWDVSVNAQMDKWDSRFKNLMFELSKNAKKDKRDLNSKILEVKNESITRYVKLEGRMTNLEMKLDALIERIEELENTLENQDDDSGGEHDD